MRLIFLSIFLVLSAGQSHSRPYIPALYDVDSVTNINVRKDPDVTSEIVGTLSHDTKAVEVVARSKDNKWGFVNSDEQTTGWVQLQSMAQAAPDPVATDFERDLFCFGDEPFWTLTSYAKADIVFSDNGTETQLARSFAPLLAINRGLGRQVMMAKANDIEIIGYLTPTQCWAVNGVFGFQFDVLTIKGDTRRFVSGCCSLSERF